MDPVLPSSNGMHIGYDDFSPNSASKSIHPSSIISSQSPTYYPYHKKREWVKSTLRWKISTTGNKIGASSNSKPPAWDIFGSTRIRRCGSGPSDQKSSSISIRVSPREVSMRSKRNAILTQYDQD
jgi:hypothetical protein